MSRELTFALAMSIGFPCMATTDCKAIDAEASRVGLHVPGYQSGRDVTGRGRLQFFSAPDANCKMPGTYILAGEKVNAYVEHKGYTAVMYMNPKTGSDAE